MATFRQIAYAINDFSKTISDDATINIHHILFLMSKYRNYLLNSNFNSIKKKISESAYQTVCIPLSTDLCGCESFCGQENVLRSIDKVPYTMTIGKKSIFPPAGFMYGNIDLVDPMKFKFIGYNKMFKNFIYATIGPDSHLYVRSQNDNFMFLDKVGLTAIFDDIEEAATKECTNTCDKVDNCELLDKRFPLDDAWLPTLMQLCVKDITGALWKPADDTNDANDEVSRFATILDRYTTQSFKNMKNAVDNSNQNS